jgi:endoglycosylceramidase
MRGVLACTILLAACAPPPPEPFVHFRPASATPVVTPSEPDPLGPLRIRGRELLDANGRTVLLHGMNLVMKSAPYVPQLGVDLTDADFGDFRDNGFNAVRLGVWYRELLPSPGVVDQTYLDHVEQVVDALAAHHLWVLLDFHQDVFTGMPDWATTPDAAALSGSAPEILDFIGWAAAYMSPRSLRQWDDLWADVPTATDPTRTIFQALGDGAAAMAQRFASNPLVMGMELMNEPFAGSRVFDCLTIGCGDLEATMASRWQSMTDRIHDVAPEFNVFWSPQAMAPHYADTALGAPALPADGSPRNVGLTFHTYCYGTDGGSLTPASDFDRGRCQAMFAASLRRGDGLAAAWNAPMMLTEFGASDNPLDATLATRTADTYLTSWFYWHMRSHLPEEVETRLARVAPQATAGDPVSLSFDPATGAFEYRYRPDATAIGPTTIVVPTRHYPDGYVVTVAGGAVTSAPDAGHVTVVADPGAPEVIVTLTRV